MQTCSAMLCRAVLCPRGRGLCCAKPSETSLPGHVLDSISTTNRPPQSRSQFPTGSQIHDKDNDKLSHPHSTPSRSNSHHHRSAASCTGASTTHQHNTLPPLVPGPIVSVGCHGLNRLRAKWHSPGLARSHVNLKWSPKRVSGCSSLARGPRVAFSCRPSSCHYTRFRHSCLARTGDH